MILLSVRFQSSRISLLKLCWYWRRDQIFQSWNKSRTQCDPCTLLYSICIYVYIELEHYLAQHSILSCISLCLKNGITNLYSRVATKCLSDVWISVLTFWCLHVGLHTSVIWPTASNHVCSYNAVIKSYSERISLNVN